MATSQLQHIDQFTPEDFNVDPEVFQEMEVIQGLGLFVNIDCLAVDNRRDGGYGYWDITLPSGAEVEAIDGYHLCSKNP
jgi:hypothetical protein